MTAAADRPQGSGTKAPRQDPSMLIHLAAILLIAGTTWAVGTFADSDELAGFGDDGPIYLIMARVLGGAPQLDPVLRASYDWHTLPPGFPLVLAASAAFEPRAAHRLVAVQLGLALILLYWLYLHHAGRPWHALVLLGAFCALPGVWLEQLKLIAENQYLILSLGILLLAERRDTDRGLWPLLLGLLFAALILTRTIGVALLAAYLAWRLLGLRKGRPPISAGLLFGLGLIGLLLARSVIMGPGSTGYLHQLAQVLSSDDSARQLLTYTANMLIGLLNGWGHHVLLFWGSHGEPRAILAFAALALALLGLARRLTRLDGLYLACYVGVLLIWPYPWNADRFLYPLLPLMLLHLYLLLTAIGRRLNRKCLGACALIAFALVIAAPSTGFVYHRFRQTLTEAPELARLSALYQEPGLPDGLEKARSEQEQIGLLRTLRLATFCPGTVLAVKPQMVTLLSGVYAEEVPIVGPNGTEDYLRRVRQSGADCVLITRINYPGALDNPQTIRALRRIADPVLIGEQGRTGEWSFVLFRLRLGTAPDPGG